MINTGQKITDKNTRQEKGSFYRLVAQRCDTGLKNKKYKWKYYDKFYLCILVLKYLIRFIGIA